VRAAHTDTESGNKRDHTPTVACTTAAKARRTLKQKQPPHSHCDPPT
jgi:hypothetical protein